MVIALGTPACYGWKHTAGLQVLPEATYQIKAQGGIPNVEIGDPSAAKTVESRRVSFVVPDGWYWVRSDNDFLATKDGVFLQKILVERIHYLDSALHRA